MEDYHFDDTGKSSENTSSINIITTRHCRDQPHDSWLFMHNGDAEWKQKIDCGGNLSGAKTETREDD